VIYDISLPISENLPVWPGDPPVQIRQVMRLDRGDEMTLTRLEMGAHTGTHVDAPAHFVVGGVTVDTLDLEVLIGPALVVHVPGAGALSSEVLDRLAIPPGTRRLLFRTRNSDLWAHGRTDFCEDFVAITEDGARWLVDCGVRLVGVDYLSVSSYRDPIPPHLVLLRAGVIALEGLNLSAVAPGTYHLVCLPLRIQGAEGAPARALLMDRPDWQD
jgi:arylformamidase